MVLKSGIWEMKQMVIFAPNADSVVKSRKIIERKHKLYDGLKASGVYEAFSE